MLLVLSWAELSEHSGKHKVLDSHRRIVRFLIFLFDPVEPADGYDSVTHVKASALCFLRLFVAVNKLHNSELQRLHSVNYDGVNWLEGMAVKALAKRYIISAV